MKFYFNSKLNLCAEESWIIGYLLYQKNIRIPECETENELKKQIELYGWRECSVSNTIEEHFDGAGLIGY